MEIEAPDGAVPSESMEMEMEGVEDAEKRDE